MKTRKIPPAAKRLAALTFTALALTAGTITAARLGTMPAAYAQSTPDSAGGTEHSHHGRMGEFLKTLNLSDDQKAKIKQIMAQTKQQNQNADETTRRANMKAAWQNIRNNVLTGDQQQKFDAHMQSMKQQGGQH